MTIQSEEAQGAEFGPSTLTMTPMAMVLGRWIRPRSKGKFMFYAGTAWLALMVFLAIFADVIPGLPNYVEKVGGIAQPPNFTLAGILGTDSLGRSTLTRIIYGARVSLTIALLSTLIALAIGLIVGLLAGYYRGITDRIATLAANVLSSLPGLIFLLALVAAIGPSVSGITVALGIVVCDIYMRMAKGTVIANSVREYVLAAKALGASDARILSRELLPTLIPVLGALIPITMAAVITAEGALSFLGYGIPPPNPSWGGMISEAAPLIRSAPWVILGPTVTLFLTIFSFNAVGDYLVRKTDKREGQL